MYCEEDYMTYIEDEGCCNAIKSKLRKKRHLIVISLLLFSAIVTILAGMFNGFTVKKYSDLAITIGIFFPGIILLFICVYLAFICGRESFRSSVLSRARHLSGGSHSRHSQGTLQYPESNPASRNNLQIRYDQKTGIESINDPLSTKIGKLPCNKRDYTLEDSIEYCDSKISRRHFKSLSNSDISKQTYKDTDVTSRKRDSGKNSNTSANVDQYSPRFRGYQDAKQHKEFKRSISDTAHKKRYSAKPREDEYVWNTHSLNKLRKDIVRMNSLNDAAEEHSYESSYEAIRKSPETLHPRKNYKNTDICEKMRSFNEYESSDRQHKNRQECLNTRQQDDIRKKNCYSKSEIRLYASGVLKAPCEYKQTLQFSSFQPDRRNIKEIEDTASSSTGDENVVPFSKNDILEMERKTKRTESAPSEQDTYRLRRKTIYLPPASSKESAQSSREYVHEYCRHLRKENNMAQHPLTRNERNFGNHQKGKQARFR